MEEPEQQFHDRVGAYVVQDARKDVALMNNVKDLGGFPVEKTGHYLAEVAREQRVQRSVSVEDRKELDLQIRGLEYSVVYPANHQACSDKPIAFQ